MTAAASEAGGSTRGVVLAARSPSPATGSEVSGWGVRGPPDTLEGWAWLLGTVLRRGLISPAGLPIGLAFPALSCSSE